MDDHELRDELRAIAGHPWLIASAAAGVVALTLGLSLTQQPTYRAETELLLGRTLSEQVLLEDETSYRSSADSAREVNNELRLIESEAVRATVDEVYDGDLPLDAVQADATSEEADVIELSATSTDPVAVAELVNAYAEGYMTAYRDRQVDELLNVGAGVQAQIDALDTEIAAGSATSRSQASLESQRAYFAEQLDELQVTTRLARSGGVQLLARADVPDEPVSPRVARNVLLACVAGLAVGVVLALLRHRFDVGVRTKARCEAAVGEPVLGLIPRATGRGRPELIAASDVGSPVSEAYRALRTSVMFLGLERPLGTVQVTSAVASEGKTTVAANLATVLAQAGTRTLLVEADLRRPRLGNIFEVPASPGLTDVLVGTATPEQAVRAIERVPNLHILPSGPIPLNPTDLLATQHAAAVLAELATIYELVVIDCPPALPVADAQLLASRADATLLVVSSGTPKRQVTDAVEALGHVDAPLVGAVFNRVTERGTYQGAYYRYEGAATRRGMLGHRGRSRTRPERRVVHSGVAGNGNHAASADEARSESAGVGFRA